MTAHTGDLVALLDDQLRRGGETTTAQLIDLGGAVLEVGDRHATVVWSDLADNDSAATAAVSAARDWADSRQVRLEWKHYGHDTPADLPQRLIAAGFVAEPEESVMIGELADLPGLPQLPAGVRLRELAPGPGPVDPAALRAELAAVDALHHAVWGERPAGFRDQLAGEKAAEPGLLSIVVAERTDLPPNALGDSPPVLCAGWLHLHPGTSFGSLWGGSTLPDWRGRGIYRATVAWRAARAALHGVSRLRVDASSESRPILARLGFQRVTSTTPYVRDPAC